nr:MAG TPA: stabilization protein [Crassvirales sp.]
MQKQITFKTKGMQRDLAASAFNPEFAYENKNIRIITDDNNTMYSLVNEKGPKLAVIDGLDSIEGTVIGGTALNNELILFAADTTDNKKDKIYKIEIADNSLKGQVLFEGNLAFNPKYPIEALTSYENEALKKIYWTDGLNSPRVINIAAASNVVSKWNSNSFDFIRKVALNETIDIKRNTESSGVFAPGIIQYAFTYFDKYGQESNIFYTSPLYYISYNDRGASPEDKIGNSFDIKIYNADQNFDYIRVYSIHRTSLDEVPNVRRVVDLDTHLGNSEVSFIDNGYEGSFSSDEIVLYNRLNGAEYTLKNYTPLNSGTNSSNQHYKEWAFSTSNYNGVHFGDGSYLTWDNYGNDIAAYITVIEDTEVKIFLSNGADVTFTKEVEKSAITYTDTGLSGDSVDPTELLYVGGEDVIVGTMTQKDNTLFLGNIKKNRKDLNSNIRNYFRGKKIEFFNKIKYIESPEISGYYPYNNQLKMNSYQFKTFKYLDYYRFGIQAQHYTGKWSDPIWINDVKNTVHIDTTFYNSGKVGLPVAQFILNNKSIIEDLYKEGYVRVRPVVVYPTINDREAICQGVLCPTVFNVSDRYGNSPFAQSSWFIRPNAPFNVDKNAQRKVNKSWKKDWNKFGEALSPSIYSRTGVVTNERVLVSETVENQETILDMDTVNKGAWAEFRNNYPIPSNTERNAEIQCIYNPPAVPFVGDDTSNIGISEWVSQNSENYYIDQSIVTLHSPDIEFDNDVKNIDTSNLKLRIVGIVPVTAFTSDIDIQTSTPVNNFKGSSNLPIGFYKEPVCVENEFYKFTKVGGNSHFGWRGLISGAFWFDEITDRKGSNKSQLTTGFVVYPWHRNGSLNNTRYGSSDKDNNGYKSAVLDKKKMSNLRFSYKTQYMDKDNIWNAYEEGDDTKTGISGVAIFDSNEVSLVRLPAQENSGLSNINYYGNVDKLLTASRSGSKKDGYPIVITGSIDTDDNSKTDNEHELFTSDYVEMTSSNSNNQYRATDPVRIKYKSTPHAILALNYTKPASESELSKQRVLPTIEDATISTYPDTVIEASWEINTASSSYSGYPFWNKNKNGKSVSQDVINPGISGDCQEMGGIQYGWLWLGELYNDNVQNRFGGQTDDAFENNVWLPCGNPVSLINIDNTTKDNITITWEEGDTYYQRYDHIKTYPFTLEDQNAVTDIISFMCETRVNIDGRYDRNRGQTSNLAITPKNFNKMNDVYSQYNNYFTYRAINPSKLNLDSYPNTIAWTKTKTNGELIDTWTNITLASTLDLDSTRGSITALEKLNDSLICLQDAGISQVLYNENTQISTTEGVPIEIANSGKVQGSRYISNTIGCSNKWSICTTPTGIYFIDDITKGIYLFNGQLNNISDKLGFHSWISTVSKGINIWNPVNFNNFVTYYDKTNDEVLFISKDSCLGYSELLGQFTSFYSYENTPYFFNLSDKGIWVKNNNLWIHNEGNYNTFFGAYQPFSTTVIANPDAIVDKVFSTVEFRADSWDTNNKLLNTTFDTLKVWNEYQQGTASLENTKDKPSNLKRKFRIWRANIPRDKSNRRDRMRNPWLYLKLSMESENSNKTILHDMTVHYFE